MTCRCLTPRNLAGGCFIIIFIIKFHQILSKFYLTWVNMVGILLWFLSLNFIQILSDLSEHIFSGEERKDEGICHNRLCTWTGTSDFSHFDIWQFRFLFRFWLWQDFIHFETNFVLERENLTLFILKIMILIFDIDLDFYLDDDRRGRSWKLIL